MAITYEVLRFVPRRVVPRIESPTPQPHPDDEFAEEAAAFLAGATKEAPRSDFEAYKPIPDELPRQKVIFDEPTHFQKQAAKEKQNSA